MPSAREILNGLVAIANSWQLLAVAWHVYFGALIGGLFFGWRPSKRVAAALLVLPVISVSVLAWIEGNFFNGTAFALLSGVLVLTLRKLNSGPIQLGNKYSTAVGALLFSFAWVYPHFLDAESVSAYLYAAPLGLVPCPTLSMALAATILFRGLGSRAWQLALLVAGLFYGVFGSFYLGVTIDWVLTGGALFLLIFLVRQAVRESAGTAK